MNSELTNSSLILIIVMAGVSVFILWGIIILSFKHLRSRITEDTEDSQDHETNPVLPKTRKKVAPYIPAKGDKAEVYNGGNWKTGTVCDIRGNQIIVHIDGQPNEVMHKRGADKVRPVD